jgi:hypothetical protein
MEHPKVRRPAGVGESRPEKEPPENEFDSFSLMHRLGTLLQMCAAESNK